MWGDRSTPRHPLPRKTDQFYFQFKSVRLVQEPEGKCRSRPVLAEGVGKMVVHRKLFQMRPNKSVSAFRLFLAAATEQVPLDTNFRIPPALRVMSSCPNSPPTNPDCDAAVNLSNAGNIELAREGNVSRLFSARVRPPLPTEAAEPLGPGIPRVSSTEPSLSPSALAPVTVAGEAAF